MKKTIGFSALALLTLAGAALVGSPLWAQAPAGGAGVRPASSTAPAAAPVGKTRVAILNLKYVVTKYNKWTTFQEQYKADYKVFEDRITPLKKQYEDKAKAVKEGKLDQTTRETYEKDLRKLQAAMQDIDEEARNTLGKKETNMMITIYNEVAAACGRYATAHEIDLVVHYNDGSTTEEMNAPQNIQRKIVSGPLTPVFWKSGVDISADVVQMLNAAYPATGGTPTKPN